MARNSTLGNLVKVSTNALAEIPGGERLVLQAVKDMLDELRQQRKKANQLEKKVEVLEARLEKSKLAVLRARASAPRRRS